VAGPRHADRRVIISETATTPPEAGKSGPAKHGPKPGGKSGGFRPIAFIRGVVKNSPWVVIAVVLHVIVFAALGIVIVEKAREKAEAPTAIDFAKEKKEDEKPTEEVATEIVDRKAIPKADTSKELELVDPDRDMGMDAPVFDGPVDLSKEAGEAGPVDAAVPSAGAIGVGAGGGQRGTGRPTAFSNRKKGDRVESKGSGGGGGPTARTEASVRDGVIWLMRHQQPDGSWSAGKMKDLFKGEKSAYKADCACDAQQKGVEYTTDYDEGLTGLALLAFLGMGQDHASKNKLRDTVTQQMRQVGAEVVLPGLKWLRERQRSFPDGRFSKNGHIYNEALATLAMCEAYGLSPGTAQWKECAQKGVDFLVAAQRLNPGGTGLWGWRYEPRAWFDGADAKTVYPDEKERRAKSYEADISATAWVVMALKSAELAGLNVPHESMQGAMEFTKSVTTKDGRVAYMNVLQVGRKIAGEGDEYMFHPTALDALGMCVRTFVERNFDDPILDMSAARIIKDLPSVKDADPKSAKDNKLGIDYYYWYYASLALNQFDGPDSPKRSKKYWNKWNEALIETLLPLQDTSNTCCRGGWPTPDRWSHAGGPIYRTAINVLTLEVYYRYENAFGAAAAVHKPKDDKGREEKGREDEKKPK
jgi:hypothetical protein